MIDLFRCVCNKFFRIWNIFDISRFGAAGMAQTLRLVSQIRKVCDPRPVRGSKLQNQRDKKCQLHQWN